MAETKVPQAVLEVTIVDPCSLNDLVKWAEIAAAAGVPSSSPVTASYHEVKVRTYLQQVPFPKGGGPK